MEYSFTLKFKLPDDKNAGDDAVMSRLGNAGCTDALVGLGSPGYVSLEFDREAKTAVKAILSAIRDVRKALPNAELVEAGPDFVGLTDIAEFAGVTRQSMRKLFVGNPASFPAPVHGGSASIWHLSPVLEFMHSRDYLIDTATMDVAFAAMQVNIRKDAALLDPRVADDVGRYLNH